MIDYLGDDRMLTLMERLIANERVAERYGIKILVSELCPPDKMYVMDPAYSDIGFFGDAGRVLVVPTKGLAEQARKVAEEAGVRVVD